MEILISDDCQIKKYHQPLIKETLAKQRAKTTGETSKHLDKQRAQDQGQERIHKRKHMHIVPIPNELK